MGRRQSDNGYHLGEHRLFFGKTEPYDTDIRLPFYIAGPGVPQGEIRLHQTTHLDITATVVDLAGGRRLEAGTPGQTAACDLVCGCTTSTEPVVPTDAVRPGAHVGLVGSYSTARREVFPELLQRASVFVDDRGAAADEAGDLILAVEADEWSFDAVVGDLAGLCLGTVGRSSDDEVTLFKSVGLAVWDLMVAGTVVRAS